MHPGALWGHLCTPWPQFSGGPSPAKINQSGQPPAGVGLVHLPGTGRKCQQMPDKERLLGIKGTLPCALPQPREGQAGLSPSCHLQGLVFISCCGSWGVGGRLQSRELKPV